MANCHCGNTASFEQCCAPIIKGERKAALASELMRARYSAYATQAIDFILSSHDPETSEETDRESLESWSRESEWLGLEILDTQRGTQQDKTGIVEFRAHFKQGQTTHAHHEVAEFTKRDGEWFFTDGKVRLQPLKREGEKVGRNDPCVCGSGKKFKKCCGL